MGSTALVVVGVDGTHCAAVALDAAFEFADRFAVKLAAVRAWSMRRPAAAVTIPFLIGWDALEAAEWAQLTEVVDRCNQRHPDVYASCFVEPTRPTAALLQHAASAQLVVVGNRGRKRTEQRGPWFDNSEPAAPLDHTGDGLRTCQRDRSMNRPRVGS